MDVTVTLSEAATLLEPPMTETQLRAIIRALRIPPAGTRPHGHRGRPHQLYQWTVLAQLHAALSPWLERTTHGEIHAAAART